MKTIALYHGNEEWVLKGIARDLGDCLKLLSHHVVYSDPFTGDWIAYADLHIFVQQGQLLTLCKRKDGRSFLHKSVCLFTHFDITSFNPNLFNKCLAIVFNSSLQMATAIANGLEPNICSLKHYGVDNSLHKNGLSPTETKALYKFLGEDWSRYFRKTVGFCGRYWNKPSYVRRKNYILILELVKLLHLNNVPTLFLGLGWEKLLSTSSDINSKLLKIVKVKYRHYPLFYNFMSVIISPSTYESGPFPVLEAMSCGVYPVVSCTGFCTDLIHSDYIGTVLPLPLLHPHTIIQKLCLYIETLLRHSASRSETLR